MSVIATQNDIANALAHPPCPPIQFIKTSVSFSAGSIASMWKSTGVPAAGVTPTVAAYCDDTTVGAPTLPSAAGGNFYALVADVISSSASQYHIYDRLSHMAGLSGTLTTAQTVNLDVATPAANGRCLATGADVEWFLDIYAIIGATVATVTVTYTNQAGVSGNTTTVALTASAGAQRLFQIIPTNGDTSIKSIQSITLSISTGTAGNIGVTAGKRLVTIGAVSNNTPVKMDYAQLGLPEIKDTACLWHVVFIGSGASTGNTNLYLTLGKN